MNVIENRSIKKYFIKLLNNTTITQKLQNNIDNKNGITFRLGYYQLIKGYTDGTIEIEVSYTVYNRFLDGLKKHRGVTIHITHKNLKKAFKNGVIPYKNQQQEVYINNEIKKERERKHFINVANQTGEGCNITKDSLITPLSNLQINYEMKHFKTFKGSIPRDLLTTDLPYNKKESFIINYDLSGKEGSHWVAVIKNNNNIYFFDSFGGPPLDEIINRYGSKCNYYWNDKIIQNIRSDLPSCGYLCISFLKFMTHNKYNMVDFINKFS